MLVVHGELSGKEDIVIEGECRGKIILDQHDLVIEKTGKVEAEVRAKNVTIHGSLAGSVIASERAFISETGRMSGDITASKISVMDGAQFKGAIKMGKGNSA
jgi:cytoskeletal protein CcmA (bactofilin family)